MRDAAASSTLPWEQARLFAEVYERIKREYVDEVDDHAAHGKGHSRHGRRAGSALRVPRHRRVRGDPPEHHGLLSRRRHRSRGRRLGRASAAPHRGSPADQAGMLAGDLIVQIDDTDVGADLAGAIARMRGPAGSIVRARPCAARLRASRSTSRSRRAKVDVHSVDADRRSSRASATCASPSFSETTADDVITRDCPPEARESQGH